MSLFLYNNKEYAGQMVSNSFILTLRLLKLQREKKKSLKRKKSRNPFEVSELLSGEFLARWEVKSSQNTILFYFICRLQNAAGEMAVQSEAVPR